MNQQTLAKWCKRIAITASLVSLVVLGIILFGPQPQLTPEQAAHVAALQQQQREEEIVNERFMQTLLHTKDGQDFILVWTLFAIMAVWGTAALFRRR